MTLSGTVLKALLDKRHQANPASFRQAYDRTARTAAPSMVGKAPPRSTLYRWMSGDVRSLPHPLHRPVLAAMFPDWELAELFEPFVPGTPLDREPAGRSVGPDVGDLAGVTRIYPNRMAFVDDLPPDRLLDDAHVLDAAGLSLNIVCQHYPDKSLVSLLNRAHVRLLFLDPDGDAIRARNAEEEHEDEHLANWTRTNLRLLLRVRDSLAPESAARVQIRVYDETIRFNILLIDGELGVVQPYLPRTRGKDSPTMVMHPLASRPDLYTVYRDLFESIWERGRPL